ncbi:MAG TPA: hypothetical protein VNZ53_19260 [Steroidobacteraceae bacterium]|jgi:hypothetical protein|nr:hypothetical protein [Steroidobacteraceae bacterium]
MKIRGFPVQIQPARASGQLTRTYFWNAGRGWTVQTWYDPHTHSWVVQTKDEQGNQILDADYVGTIEDRDAAFEARCYAQSPMAEGV